jgi:hypothetical protein
MERRGDEGETIKARARMVNRRAAASKPPMRLAEGLEGWKVGERVVSLP